MSALGLKLHPNTDDPTLHNVSPGGAWELMYSHLGYDIDDLRAMMLNGVDGCWADDDQKAAWRAAWPTAFDALARRTDGCPATATRGVTGLTATIIRRSRAAAADIPPATLEMAKLCVLDWFGLALGGVARALDLILRDAALAEGARPVAAVVGHGRAFSPGRPPWSTAWPGHALDYDDVNLAMRVHPTTVILPGLLALAEAQRLTGRRCSRPLSRL
jgi:hypothetical protein